MADYEHLQTESSCIEMIQPQNWKKTRAQQGNIFSEQLLNHLLHLYKTWVV